MGRGTLREVQDGSGDPSEVGDGLANPVGSPGRFVGPFWWSGMNRGTL